MRFIPIAVVVLAACGDGSHSGTTPDSIDSTDSTDAADVSPDAADTAPEVVAPSFCEGTTAFAWDPDDGTQLAAYPNDALTIDDAATQTGLHVKVGAPKWLADQPQFFQSVWHQIESLDGFGTSAGVMLRFSAPIAAPPSGSATATSNAIALFDLGQTPPVEVPYEAQVLDGGATVILWPMRPLRESTLHGVVVSTYLKDANGGCIAPSEPLRATLTHAPGQSPALARLQTRFDKLVSAAAGLGIQPGDISAATVFTTEAFTVATLHQRDDLRAQRFSWKDAPTCETTADFVRCVGDFIANDYRIEGDMNQALDPAFEPQTYQLPVHIWLPTRHTGKVPVLVFGHGLGGDATQGEPLAALAATKGMATVAISAPRHGDHPTATATDPQTVFTQFFGIDLGTFSIDGFVFRENLRQAAFDKLQVLELLRAEADVDGDGQADLDMDRVAYWGISLGGIFGPNFVAMSDTRAAILSVPGARMISFISDAADFKQFFDLLASLSGGPDALLRQAPVAQALIDGADPVNWATHIFKDPIGRPDVPPPQLLLQMVMNDGTVPNVATRALARALEVPQVPTVIVPIDLLDAEPSAPVSANLSATLTAGLFQFDRYSTKPGGTPKVATHAGVFSGIEAIDQVSTFLDTWLDGGDAAPTIIDPYAQDGTPPLE